MAPRTITPRPHARLPPSDGSGKLVLAFEVAFRTNIPAAVIDSTTLDIRDLF